MDNNFNKIRFIVGNEDILLNMKCVPVDEIFAERRKGFLNKLSHNILQAQEAKTYADVITFAFWCRRASIEGMEKEYKLKGYWVGRGTVFHIAPSNVAVNFAYSFAAAFLSGNNNIVRLPSKRFEQVEIICQEILATLEEYPDIAEKICFIQYEHDKQVTDYLSYLAAVRIVWGGDHTIAEIRKSPIHVRAKEINFANRFSIAIIDGSEYIKRTDKNLIAQSFYNDTYLNDQNACTAPKLVVWLRSNTHIRKVFWEHLYTLVCEKYEIQSIQAVDKLEMLYMLSLLNNGKISYRKDNLLICLEQFTLDSEIFELNYNSGLFVEYVAEDLSELNKIANLKCQTVSFLGISKEFFANWLGENKPHGIDRIVEMGHTLDFTLNWDGYDLINELSRRIYL